MEESLLESELKHWASTPRQSSWVCWTFHSTLNLKFFLGCWDANKGKHWSPYIHLKVSMLSVSFHESLPLSQYPENLKSLWMHSIHKKLQILIRVLTWNVCQGQGENFLFLFLALPCRLQDLRSLTRKWTQGHNSEKCWVLPTGSPGNSWKNLFAFKLLLVRIYWLLYIYIKKTYFLEKSFIPKACDMWIPSKCQTLQ